MSLHSLWPISMRNKNSTNEGCHPTKDALAHLQKQCKVLCTNIDVGDVSKTFWTVHLQGVTDITMPRVHLKLLASHMRDTPLVYDPSCLFIRIKAAKEYTRWTASLFSWNGEVSRPSILQPCHPIEPEGLYKMRTCALYSVTQSHAPDTCKRVACGCRTMTWDDCLPVLKPHLVRWHAFVACIACLRVCSMNLPKLVGCRISSSL